MSHDVQHSSISHNPSRLDEPARSVVWARVSSEPLDPAAHQTAVRCASAGAVASFDGVIRNHDHGASVSAVHYVAHPSAELVAAAVAADIAARFPLDAIAISHRVGELVVGDIALTAAVSSAHRQEAFAAIEALVAEIKHRLPVWKHQFLTDGTDEWVNCP